MKKTNKLFIRAVLQAILVFTIIGFLITFLQSRYPDNHISLDTGWTIIYNGQVYNDVTLSQFQFQHNTQPGDVITLKNTLPKNVPANATLRILNYLTCVDVRINGVKIYTYGHDLMANHIMVGSGYHFIPLLDKSSGQTIEVEFTPSERNAFSNIPVFWVMPTSDAYTEFAADNLWDLFSGIFLFVMGVCVLLLASISAIKKTVYTRLINISLFSMLIGIWILCNSKVIELFTVNYSVFTQIEYPSLFLSVVSMCFLIRDMRQDSVLWKRMILDLCCVVLIIFNIIAIILHLSGIAHFPSLLSVFHGLLLVIFAVFIIAGFQSFKTMPITDQVINIAFLVICLFAAFDLLRFNIQKFLFPSLKNFDLSILPYGTMIFIILLLVSYIFYIYEMVIKRVEAEALEKAAYRDPMTGLYNRAYCEKLFKEYSENSNQYAIVHFDVNGLKKMNDTYGHVAGDELLIIFAELLEKIFSDFSYVIRMGGDEFVVLVDENHIRELLRGISKMENFEKEASVRHNMNISAAYGIAYSKDLSESEIIHNKQVHLEAELVYQNADAKMYEMKKKML